MLFLHGPLQLIYRLTAVRTAERHLVLKGGSHNDIKVMPTERLGVDHPYAYLDNSAAAKHKLDADESAFGLSELAMRGQVARSSVMTVDDLLTSTCEREWRPPVGVALVGVALVVTSTCVQRHAPRRLTPTHRTRLVRAHEAAVEEHHRRRG